jgi:hypothetical protein
VLRSFANGEREGYLTRGVGGSVQVVGQRWSACIAMLVSTELK